VSRFIYFHAKCHYAECFYTECRYAECRGAGECRYVECPGSADWASLSISLQKKIMTGKF
jgi:hypothetical protein